jgi:DNA-binding PadR family transcriptional regulator
MHGHQIRRNAEQDRTDRWTDFTVGSLYGALKRMAAEGVIEVHATERDGNLPARTIYAITDQGRDELVSLRAEALSDVRLRADPIDLALQYSDDMSTDELRRIVDERRLAIAGELDSWRDLLEYASPHLKGLEPVIVRHTQVRLEAELAWHEELLASLEGLDRDTSDTPESHG